MICLDASFVVAAFLPEEQHAARARRLIADWTAQGIDFVAPDLWTYEVTAVVYKALKRGRLPARDGTLLLDSLEEFLVSLLPPPSQARVVALARTFDLPAAYDAQYLAVAEAEGIDFWTGDRRLYDRVHSALSWVHCLDEQA